MSGPLYMPMLEPELLWKKDRPRTAFSHSALAIKKSLKIMSQASCILWWFKRENIFKYYLSYKNLLVCLRFWTFYCSCFQQSETFGKENKYVKIKKKIKKSTHRIPGARVLRKTSTMGNIACKILQDVVTLWAFSETYCSETSWWTPSLSHR